MKKLLVLLSLCWFFSLARGQVLINLQLPPSGVTIKSQLWNFSLVNTSVNEMTVQVELTLTDLSNNQRVLTGTSKLFQLPKGVRQVQANDVMPIVYNVISNGYGIDNSADGFLPVGVFDVCFTVMRVQNDASEQLTEECETIEIEPISPPMLITPSDSDRIEITRPLFAWLPPTPFYLFNRLQYDWVLVEVQPFQTGATAIQQNIPLLSQSNLYSNSLQFPAGRPELDTGKLYAWQVTAKNNINAIAKSEVWTFRVQKPGLDTSVTAMKDRSFYAKLSQEENGSFVICFGRLLYEYQNTINSSMIDIKLTDITGAIRKQVLLDSMTYRVNTGQNFMYVDLNESGLKDKHIYLLEVTDANLQRRYLKFEFRKIDLSPLN